MNDEKMKILEMLEKGEITAEQASALLSQVSPHKAERRERKEHDPFGIGWSGLSAELGNIVEEVTSGIEEVTSSLSEVFGNSFFTEMKGERVSFSQSSGAIQGDIASVKLISKNAKLVIIGHDENFIRLSGEYVAKHSEARPVINLEGNKVEIAYDYHAMHSMKILCELPNVFIERLQLDNKNSSIKVSEIRCRNLSAKTKNASIKLSDVEADKAILETSNASIATEEVKFNQLYTKTSNASIKLHDFLNGAENAEAYEHEVEAYTTNASISVELPENFAYKIQATTTNAGVKCDLDDMDYEKQTKTYLNGKSPNYEQTRNRIKLNLSTTNASIKIE